MLHKVDRDIQVLIGVTGGGGWEEFVLVCMFPDVCSFFVILVKFLRSSRS